jgi:AcrR family transcriptional regulator
VTDRLPTATTPRSHRGRQAEAARNDAGVLAAARVVFATHGPEASVTRIADQAGVGIGTLYRRFPSKEELLQYLSRASLDEQIAEADAAAAETDAWTALARFITRAVEVRAGALSALAGRFHPRPETVTLAQLAHERVEALVSRAQDSGKLRSDVTSTDIHHLVAMFSRRAAEDGHQYRRLLAIALSGLRSTEPALPAPQPIWQPYAERWQPR